MNAKQLKNSILQWAIQGKLVPQDPNDEPASALLERIRAEKARLVKEGKLKKKEFFSSNIFRNDDGRWLETIGDKTTDVSEAIPFDVPNNWKWVRLKDIASLITKGSSPSWQGVKYVDEGILFITSENVREGYLDLSSPKYLEDKFNDLQSRSILKKGDLLTNIVGASIGRTAEFNLELGNCNINQAVAIIRLIELSLNAYLLKVLNSPFVIVQMIGKTVETARPNISLGSVENLFIPLPPLAEQHRIVAKIEELMPLVEKYGAAQDALDEWNKTLPEKLKKSILQEAIQGRLVPQDPSDEPASALLERIRTEKARLVKEGKLKKKDLEVKPIAEDEIPFEIPKGWECVRLADICQLNDGEKRTEQHVCMDAKFLRGKKSGEIVGGGKFVRKGDHIILVDGENSGEVFTTPCDGYMGSTFKQLWISDEMHIPFVLKFIRFYKELLRNSKKGAAIPHLNKEIFYSLPIGIPSLSEQQRIVAKVEELFEKIKSTRWRN